MRILITGGTGLIGRALCERLGRAGHELAVLSRKPDSVAGICGPNVAALGSLEHWSDNVAFDAVINLAGAPIVGKRWSDRRKQLLWDSRVTLTRELVERMTAAKHPPAVLISGSAIGYYGDTGDAVIDESAEANADFGARLCEAWEVEASHAEAAGVRVCTLRTGLVLSASGGMLGQMMTGFRLGLGGRLGNGRQWMSWIHMEDQLGIIEKLLGDASCRGPYNLTAPAPVTNADFTRALARALGRPAFLSVPGAVIKAALGESAYLLLGGQKVLPRRAQAAGYEFRFDDLSTALADLLE